MNKPEVSVIVPVYNVEKYLHRCMNSILNQTLENIEIILVDDGSTDTSGSICDEYAKIDKRVKVIHKKNEGLGFARNSGIEIATGEYIGFIDSDDYIDLSMFEKLYYKANEFNVDYVRCEYKIVNNKGVSENKTIFPLSEGYYEKSSVIEKLVLPIFGKSEKDTKVNDLGVSVCKCIFKNQIIKTNKIKFYSEREYISEDFLFTINYLMNSNSAYVINECLYNYVMNQESLTHVYRSDRFNKEQIFFNKLVEVCKEYKLFSECKIRLNRFILDRARSCIKLEFITNSDSYLKKRKNVLEILNSIEVKKACKAVQIYKLPIKYAIVGFFIKYKFVEILYLFKNKL